jgi:hypothetical protein
MHASNDIRRSGPGAFAVQVLAMLLALLAAGSVLAQPADADPVEQARTAFLQGVDFAQAEKWEEARQAFARSVELYATAPGLLNLGLSLRQLSRNAEAVRAFDRFLAEFGETAEPADRQDATNQLAELRPQVGEIAVQVDADGASVLVDDQQVGTAPLAAPYVVEPGSHVVVARLPGRDPVQQEVVVAAGARQEVALVVPPVQVAGGTEGGDGTTIEEGGGGGTDPVWFWTAVGVTGAAAVAWAITGGLALAKADEFASSSTRTAEQRDEGLALATGADVCGALAGVAAAATLVLAFTTDWSGGEEPEAAEESTTADVTGITAAPVAGGMALGIVGRF